MDNGREGARLSDQVKSVDWRARKAARKGRVSDSTLAEVRAKVRASSLRPCSTRLAPARAKVRALIG